MPDGSAERVAVVDNAEFLRLVREYMLKSAQRNAAREAERIRAEGGGSSSDGAQGAARGRDSEIEDDDPNVVVEDALAVCVEGELISDKTPQAPAGGGGGVGDCTVEEQLSGAVYAPSVNDRRVSVTADGAPAYVGQVNPPGVQWKSIVPPESA